MNSGKLNFNQFKALSRLLNEYLVYCYVCYDINRFSMGVHNIIFIHTHPEPKNAPSPFNLEGYLYWNSILGGYGWNGKIYYKDKYSSKTFVVASVCCSKCDIKWSNFTYKEKQTILDDFVDNR